MMSFKNSNWITILVISVLASLIDGQDSKTSFTLRQMRSKSSVKSGSAALSSIHHKFNKRAPQNVPDGATVSQSTVVASPSDFDEVYLAPITIGGQTLNLQIDTGSDSLWAFSSDFASSVPLTYDPSKSATSKLQNGSIWQENYEDQSSVGGDTYTETVSVGDVTVDNQIIGVAREVTSNFFGNDNVRDGIFGLSFNRKSMNVPDYTTFFENVKASLSAPIFTADLKKGNPGSYDFGFIDESKYTGEISYVPINTSQGFWEFTGNGFAIGTDNLNTVAFDVIADTGTSLILLPKQIVDAYYASVPNAVYSAMDATYSFPCNTALPSISFNIGNYNAVVPGPFMNYDPLSDDITCLGGIQLSDDSGPSILGDVFLKSQFVVFDAGNEPRIGFAAKPL